MGNLEKLFLWETVASNRGTPITNGMIPNKCADGAPIYLQGRAHRCSYRLRAGAHQYSGYNLL